MLLDGQLSFLLKSTTHRRKEQIKNSKFPAQAVPIETCAFCSILAVGLHSVQWTLFLTKHALSNRFVSKIHFRNEKSRSSAVHWHIFVILFLWFSLQYSSLSWFVGFIFTLSHGNTCPLHIYWRTACKIECTLSSRHTRHGCMLRVEKEKLIFSGFLATEFGVYKHRIHSVNSVRSPKSALHEYSWGDQVS